MTEQSLAIPDQKKGSAVPERRSLAGIAVGLTLILVVFALPWILRGVLPSGKAAYWTHILVLVIIMILATCSMRAIFRTGEMSLGTAGFMLLGGYGSALLCVKLGLSPWLTIFLGGLFAAFIALLVAYPFFRVKGIYFVICTLLLSFIFLYITGYWKSLTSGWQGMQFYQINPVLRIGSHTITFGTKTNTEYYYLALVVVGICLIILYRMEHSRIGMVWNSIREADELAKSVGVNIMAQKIFIFTVAGFFIGIAGSLYAFHVHALSPTTAPGNWFHFFTSVYCLLYMVVGGAGSFYGPIIGTALFMILREFARPLDQYWPFLAGSVMILVVFFMPKGLIAIGEYLPEWYGKLRGLFRKRPEKEAAVPDR
jgi:branched-chain amino acid transport system permease protein